MELLHDENKEFDYNALKTLSKHYQAESQLQEVMEEAKGQFENVYDVLKRRKDVFDRFKISIDKRGNNIDFPENIPIIAETPGEKDRSFLNSLNYQYKD